MKSQFFAPPPKNDRTDPFEMIDIFNIFLISSKNKFFHKLPKTLDPSHFHLSLHISHFDFAQINVMELKL